MWLLPVVFGALVFKLSVWCGADGYVSGLRAAATARKPNTTGSNHLYNTLELLMMGIVVPETCWASNNICNKNPVLHLVVILFPHIKDEARSKSHQIGELNFLTHLIKTDTARTKWYCGFTIRYSQLSEAATC
jgi:hypothetical protein